MSSLPMCILKNGKKTISHESEAEAAYALMMTKKDTGQKLANYMPIKCKKCGYWHVALKGMTA